MGLGLVNPARHRGEASPGSDVVDPRLSCGKREVLLAHIWCALWRLDFSPARCCSAPVKIILAMLVQSLRGSGALAADARFPSRITGCGGESATPEVT